MQKISDIKKKSNASLYLTACPQDKFLPDHSAPVLFMYTGLNMLIDSLLLLSNKQGKFLVFTQMIESRYQAVKKKRPFLSFFEKLYSTFLKRINLADQDRRNCVLLDLGLCFLFCYKHYEGDEV